jgi:flagellar motility protein MotE (MotC chaperone)
MALVLTLGVKLGGMWSEFFSAGVRPSLAQQAPAQPEPAAKAAAQKQAKPAEEKPATAASPAATAPAQGQAQGQAEGPAQGQAQDQANRAAPASAKSESRKPGSLPDDPALLSQAEIDLLQKLAARRGELGKWAQELEMREGLLKAAEQRIDRKVGELRDIQVKIKGMLRQYDKEQEDKLKSLVKIYETMKPKEAARIFMELDMPVLLDVVERMKEAKASAVMSRLEPEKAKKLTTELAKRRKIGADAKARLPASSGAESPDPVPQPAEEQARNG